MLSFSVATSTNYFDKLHNLYVRLIVFFLNPKIGFLCKTAVAVFRAEEGVIARKEKQLLTSFCFK